MPPTHLVVPLTLTLLATLAVTLSIWLMTRDSLKAATITSFLVITFFAYGRIYGIRDSSTHGIDDVLIRHRYLLPGLMALSGLAILVSLRIQRRRLFIALSVVALTAVSVTAANTSTLVATWNHDFKPLPTSLTIGVKEVPTETLPDIYYLIYDAYASGRALEEVWDFDNTNFERSLEERGFVVARDSRSNYASTYLSLASTFNMAYLLDPTYPTALAALRSNNVFRVAKDLGYRVVVIDSNDLVAENLAVQADEFVTMADSTEPVDAIESPDGRSAPQSRSKHRSLFPLHTELTAVLMQSTPIEALIFMVDRISERFIEEDGVATGLERGFFQDMIDVHHFSRGNIVKIPEMTVPTLTVLYTLQPHAPFIFNRDGQIKSNIELDYLGTGAMEPYLDQLIYVNSTILTTIDAIEAKTYEEPIIVVQADHGPRICECESDSPDWILDRVGILSAFHLPEGCNVEPYSHITPVNTFRLIFDSCFGQEFGLVEDASYVDIVHPPLLYSTPASDRN